MTYFIDTWFWAALLNKRDPHHKVARRLSAKVSQSKVVTSQLVLMELLSFCSKMGPDIRTACVELVRKLKVAPNTIVFPHSDQLYCQSLALYAQHNDKDWSLVDCASFIIMQEKGIHIAVSGDHHFEQRGYQLLA
jgi:predicted nucleic acid-binding protein